MDDHGWDATSLRPTLSPDEVLREAHRCLQCEDPPCRSGCGAHVDIPRFIRRLRDGDRAGAAAVLGHDNVLYGTCAWVCETSAQCQAGCTAARTGRAIDIGALQRAVAEAEAADGLPAASSPPASTGRHVAVLGAGPAGLGCAAELARMGHRVTVVERGPEPGGVLRHGIPPYRLPRAVVDADLARVAALGVEIVCGATPDPRALLEEHDALFVGTGLGRPFRLSIPGEDLPGVFSARAILAALARGERGMLSGRAVVIGGGNTSMDAATAALALGADEVTLVYRRSEAEMPAWPREVELARRLGVTVRTLTGPLEVVGEGRVEGLRCQPMTLVEAGGRSRRRPVPAGDATYVLAADVVIVAVGEGAETAVVEELGLETDRYGVVQRDHHGRTSVRGVFAGGDVSAERESRLARRHVGQDAGTVVGAVGDGRRAAAAIDAYLRGDAAAALPSDPPDYRFGGLPGVDLAVTQCGVRFDHPFILAAAPPTDDLDMVRRAFEAGWAGAVLKTTSVPGNPVDLKYPMMASMEIGGRRVSGLGNIDLISEHHADEIERRVRVLKAEFPDRVVVPSIMGGSRDDWQTLAALFHDAGADLIECSFSCPQGTIGSAPGAMLGQDAALVEEVTAWVVEGARGTPVVVKLTPLVADIAAVAAAARRGGAAAICASNTIPSLMGVDLDTYRPRPTVGGKATSAGLSGPAILPQTLRTIAEITRQVDVEITGTGGPATWADAVALMAVGATTVQVCTAVMVHGLAIVDDLTEGLARHLRRQGLASPMELVGRALPHVAGHDELDQPAPVVSTIDPATCIGCGRCHVACRDGGHQAIGWDAERRLATVDEQRCVGCALCTLVCPVGDCMHMEERTR